MRVSQLLCIALVPAVAAGTTAAAQTPASPAPAAQAPAQNTPMPSDGGTGWRVECANDGKALDCQTVNKVSQRESGQVVAAVAIRIPPDTKKPVLRARPSATRSRPAHRMAASSPRRSPTKWSARYAAGRT